MGLLKKTTVHGPKWRLQILHMEPETRWFRRIVLRRKYRWVLISSLVPKGLEYTRSLNKVDTMTFVGGEYLLEEDTGS